MEEIDSTKLDVSSLDKFVPHDKTLTIPPLIPACFIENAFKRGGSIMRNF